MSATILVTYGTKHGSTQEVAFAVAETLQAHGLAMEMLPAARVDDLAPYLGVVVGGAIYMGRWHPDALGFLERHGTRSRRCPWRSSGWARARSRSTISRRRGSSS